MTCDHDFRCDGMVFELGDNCPGSGAKWVHYYHLYSCSRCLHMVAKATDVQHDSYQKARFDAKPMPLGVVYE